MTYNCKLDAAYNCKLDTLNAFLIVVVCGTLMPTRTQSRHAMR